MTRVEAMESLSWPLTQISLMFVYLNMILFGDGVDFVDRKAKRLALLRRDAFCHSLVLLLSLFPSHRERRQDPPGKRQGLFGNSCALAWRRWRRSERGCLRDLLFEWIHALLLLRVLLHGGADVGEERRLQRSPSDGRRARALDEEALSRSLLRYAGRDAPAAEQKS